MYALLNALTGVAPGGQGIPGRSPGGRGYWPKSHPNYRPLYDQSDQQANRSQVALPLAKPSHQEIPATALAMPKDVTIPRETSQNGPGFVPHTTVKFDADGQSQEPLIDPEKLKAKIAGLNQMKGETPFVDRNFGLDPESMMRRDALPFVKNGSDTMVPSYSDDMIYEGAGPRVPVIPKKAAFPFAVPTMPNPGKLNLPLFRSLYGKTQ